MVLLAHDVMQKHVVTVTPETSVEDLADLLIGSRIGGVPVLDGEEIVGVVSRSDFARALSLERTLAALTAEGEDRDVLSPGEAAESVKLPPHLLARLEGRRVRDIMSPAPLTVLPETPIQEVADLMASNHLHRVLVVDGKALRGVISALDIVALVASRQLEEA